MKKYLLFPILLSVVLSVTSCSSNNNGQEKAEEISISFSGAFAMYPLVQVWAQEYNKTYPNIRLDIQAGGAGKGLTDCLTGAVDIGMFSREITEAEKAKGVWWLSMCKDAVLPTMNANNPHLKEIQSRGITKDEFKAIFTDQSISTWQQLLGKSDKADKINVYTRADAAGAADAWASFLGKKQENLKGVGVSGDPGVADAVRKDVKAIGYNNTLFVFNAQTGKKIPGIEIVPIDVNGNGKIDPDENFYDDLSTFLKAVNDGRFPSPPARELYFITKGKPVKKEITDFFKWCLTDGQKFVSSAGFVPLPADILNAQTSKMGQ